MVTWRFEVKCPYCPADLTRLDEKARIEHKIECHKRQHKKEIKNGVVVVKVFR